MSRVLPEGSLHARQVSAYRCPRLRVGAAACLRLCQDTGVRDLATGSSERRHFFAELKNYIGLRRLRLRRMRFVREQFYLAATAQNLKRLV